MNPITVIVGFAAIAYGIYTTRTRRVAPEKFTKLAAMKQAWGEKAGMVVHVVGYTVLPVVLGLVLILTGLRGGSLF